MLHELRRYRTAVSAAAEFRSAFETELLPLLSAADFDLIAAWTVEVGDGCHSDLIWLLRWTSYEAREQALSAIHADPHHAVFNERWLPVLTSVSNELLRPAAFSPLV